MTGVEGVGADSRIVGHGDHRWPTYSRIYRRQCWRLSPTGHAAHARASLAIGNKATVTREA